MASIGGVTCTFVRGKLPIKKQRVEVYNLPGLDGYGVVLLGLGDSAGELVAELLSNAAGVALWQASLQALQGTIVTVVNDLAETTNNVLIASVSPVVVEPFVSGSLTQRAAARIGCVVL